MLQWSITIIFVDLKNISQLIFSAWWCAECNITANVFIMYTRYSIIISFCISFHKEHPFFSNDLIFIWIYIIFVLHFSLIIIQVFTFLIQIFCFPFSAVSSFFGHVGGVGVSGDNGDKIVSSLSLPLDVLRASLSSGRDIFHVLSGLLIFCAPSGLRQGQVFDPPAAPPPPRPNKSRVPPPPPPRGGGFACRRNSEISTWRGLLAWSGRLLLDS